jgi:hypothetical protein
MLSSHMAGDATNGGALDAPLGAGDATDRDEADECEGNDRSTHGIS